MKTKTKKIRGVAFGKKKKLTKYQRDPIHRALLLSKLRAEYRKNKALNVRRASVSLADIGAAATIRVMEGGGKLKCISSGELAHLAGYHAVTLYKWQARGLFPKPTLAIATGPGAMYSIEQAKRLLDVLRKHQQKHQYLYESDTATVADLFAAMK